MKKFVAVLLLMCLCSFARGQSPTTKPYRGEPFGFKLGMTRETLLTQISSKSVEKDEEGILVLRSAPKAHPDFDTYIICVSPTVGISKVLAFSKPIDTNSFGESVKARFQEVRDAVSGKYGAPDKTYDFLLAGSIWGEPNDWMMGLLKDERRLVADWESDGTSSITVEAVASSSQVGHIRIIYEFSNFGTWHKEFDQKRNKSF